jgi:hypothetical protein
LEHRAPHRPENSGAWEPDTLCSLTTSHYLKSTSFHLDPRELSTSEPITLLSLNFSHCLRSFAEPTNESRNRSSGCINRRGSKNCLWTDSITHSDYVSSHSGECFVHTNERFLQVSDLIYGRSMLADLYSLHEERRGLTSATVGCECPVVSSATGGLNCARVEAVGMAEN